ncbi:phenylalanine--tRNA ligase subunit alpha [Candidatus Nitrososphaera sp. FF02]|uniref:phenylalanine--tRNA ligase subunit alpha n=1 Tax=Candidatus Nitrososphaera sp. FF02 TaxID=3398226 RepID=UPI0039E77F4A
MSSDAVALHPIERSILKALVGAQLATDRLAQAASLSIDQARRGIEWLKSKNLVSVNELVSSTVSLDAAGRGAAQFGLPERRLVRAVKEGKATMADVLTAGALKGEEVNAAVAGARRNQWVQFDAGNRMAAAPAAENKSPEELLLERLADGDCNVSALSEQEKKGLDLLKKRPNYVSIKEQKDTLVSISDSGRALLPAIESEKVLERRLTPELIMSGKWKQVELSALDVEAPAPVVHAGRSHPLVDIIEEVKEIFVGLGFSEIDGPVVQSGFWNFDALFTPQDHPAREMQDTFYVSGERQPVPASKEQAAKVSAVHRQGWGGWSQKEAERVVLRTHTTPVTLQHLAKLQPETARFFSVGRVFRNEKVSYKHLVEFHQVEGVATAPRASLRDLMGLQKEFYARMGIKKIKFWPTFFPYTEPSLQSMVYNEKLQKWVELFGMGIFRPEVTKPLGIKNPVLAWGGGLERIAMLRFGLDDVRDLYANRVSWLRSVPRCQL